LTRSLGVLVFDLNCTDIKEWKIYDNVYAIYSLTDATVNGDIIPQCAICFVNFNDNALKTSYLQRHLQ